MFMFWGVCMFERHTDRDRVYGEGENARHPCPHLFSSSRSAESTEPGSRQ